MCNHPPSLTAARVTALTCPVWQSKETEKLIRRNDSLKGENGSLRRELSLHKQTQLEFARKVFINSLRDAINNLPIAI